MKLPGFLNFRDTDSEKRINALTTFFIGLVAFVVLAAMTPTFRQPFDSFIALLAFLSLIAGIWEGIRYSILQEKFKREH